MEDALEMSLLLDYYGGMLTEKQRVCLDLRFNQDLSLGEIAENLGISRQAVCDNLTRTEAALRKMEKALGCVNRDRKVHAAADKIMSTARILSGIPDPSVSTLAQQIVAAVQELEE